MDQWLNRVPRWLVLLLGLTLLGLAVEALASDMLKAPSLYGFLRRDLPRGAQPLAYWSLLAAYVAGAVFLLRESWRRYATEDDTWQPPPSAPRPAGLSRALAWTALVFSMLMLAAGIAAHFMMDPIIRLPFVAVLGGGGLMLGLAAAGFLLTGRLR